MKNFKLLVLFSALWIGLAPAVAQAVERQEAYVQEVLTGDTVRLKGGKLLRYAGLEAPPLQHSIPLVRVYGENAKAFNTQLVAGKKISIEWGNRMRDEHNTLLGYVYLQDGTFANLELLKSGNAKAKVIAPNLAYADVFRRAALNAQRERLGVWKEEPKNPYLKEEYLGDKNTKIYYLPNSPELEHIPQGNLVPFRSRVEASAARYRACSNCKGTGQTSESDTLY